MYLRALQTAVPPRAFTPQECWEAFSRSPARRRLTPTSAALVQKVLLGNSGVEKRHFALTDLENLFEMAAQPLAEAFEREAPTLAARAVRKALAEANLEPGDLDALFVCTCTGYICPGVSSHVAEQVGMHPHVALHDLVGLGCGAALPTLRAARGFLAAEPGAKVAVVAVEVCSAAFYLDDDPGVIVSACIFGDGAAALILDDEPRGWRFHGFDTFHAPEGRPYLRFENAGGKLRNRLHVSVPRRAAAAVKHLHERRSAALEREARQLAGMRVEARSDEAPRIIAHTGGREVLKRLEETMQVALPSSWRTLNAYGNQSSPSVLFALEDHLRGGGGDRHLWLTSFGAGFSAHSCHLTRED